MLYNLIVFVCMNKRHKVSLKYVNSEPNGVTLCIFFGKPSMLTIVFHVQPYEWGEGGGDFLTKG